MTQLQSILITVLIILLFVTIVGVASKGLGWSKIKRKIDRALSISQLSQVGILILFITFVFAFLVFLTASFSPAAGNENYSIRFWHALGHFFNPGAFQNSDIIPKGWIMVINILGMILMTGLMISVLSNLLERRVDYLKNGRIFYNFKSHFVIIGYDKMTVSLVRQLSKINPDNEIILQTIQDVPTVRHDLFSYLSKDIENKVIILNGNRNSREDLEKLCLNNAKRILILGESDEYDHDSLNIECFKKINKILNKNNVTDEKPCHVLFDNQSTYAVLQQQDLIEFLKKEDKDESEQEKPLVVWFKKLFAGEKSANKKPAKKPKLEFLPFNFHELWAQKIFVDNTYKCTEDSMEDISYLPLDRNGIDYNSDKTVHLVVLGMSKMGVALGIQASHLCHFPNFIKNSKLKTKITFIDEEADQEMHFLQGRYCHFFKEIDHSFTDIKEPGRNINNSAIPNTKGETTKFTDIEWNFIKGRIEDPIIQDLLISYCSENSFLTIAVCNDLPAHAVAIGLYLPDAVYKKEDAQILVKQNTPHSILSMLKNTARYKNVKPFGMLDNCLEIENMDDDIPLIVKYIYDMYWAEQKQATSIPPLVNLRDKWKSSKTVKKWSNRYNANTIEIKKRSFKINDTDAIKEENILLLAKVEHNRWNVEELLLGYRPTKTDECETIGTNPQKKEELKNDFIHNDICPFEKISYMDIEPEEDGNKIYDPREYDKCLSKALPMIIKYKKDKE